MRVSFFAALGLGLMLSFAPVKAASDGDTEQAKTFLKDYLKQVNQKYPFTDWEKQLSKFRNNLERARAREAASGPGFNNDLYLSVQTLGKDVQEAAKHRADVEKLVKELYVSSMISRIDGMFSQAGKRWDPDARLSFQRTLMQYESGSLKPKTAYLANSTALDRDFTALQTDVLFAFAQDYLGRRVEEHLRAFNFAKIEALYDDYSLQLDYWTKEFQANATQTQEQLAQLSRKFEENRVWLRQNLESLIEVLNTDMLFSDLLEYASKQKVDFTLEVEERIENALKEQNKAVLAPIQERIVLWKNLAAKLREKTAMAQELALNQKTQAMARAEDERKENERLEALKSEQRRLEDEQKAKFKQTLTALRTFTFKSETSVELDDDSKKALTTKAGFLKTSYVRSGSNRLKVDKEKFSDTLAMVQKFTVEEGQVDFSKMSLQERSNQSAYTYASPAGRTSEGDLANFVAEVALGSFSSFYTFLSYLTPERWTPGHRFSWSADRGPQKANQDREFSYVDLVVDAHRKRSGGSTRGESSANLPANMIIIFDPQGSIIRFQSFADIDQVSIRSGDVVGGKLYYKFLNYSTDRQHIYLNGIDAEMKVGIPSGKS